MSTSERHVRLFRNGRNQALRIPREFELEGEEALIHREGDRGADPQRQAAGLSLSIDRTFPRYRGESFWETYRRRQRPSRIERRTALAWTKQTTLNSNYKNLCKEIALLNYLAWLRSGLSNAFIESHHLNNSSSLPTVYLRTMYSTTLFRSDSF